MSYSVIDGLVLVSFVFFCIYSCFLIQLSIPEQVIAWKVLSEMTYVASLCTHTVHIHVQFECGIRTRTCEIKQESLADAKVSARQQCVYEDP